jgi:hypothetical protein
MKGTLMTLSLDEQMAGIDARMDWFASRIDALEVGPVRPTRWCWKMLGEQATGATWSELREWVDWLTTRYNLDEVVPPCWWSHDAMIEELTALYAGWHAAYMDFDARGFDPLAWHEALDRSLVRVQRWNRQGCRPESHRDDPPTLRVVTTGS